MIPLLAEQNVVESPLAGAGGFIPGSRGSLMLDVVFLAMFAIIPVMGWSIYLVKYRRNYSLHKQVQITLGIVLLLAVTAFEIDMRFFTDWEVLAQPSRFYTTPDGWNWVWYSLVIHLLFAIPTTFLWIFVIVQAVRKFPQPPHPNEYSPRHLFWAKLAAFEMLMTAVTGWVFYVLAFVM